MVGVPDPQFEGPAFARKVEEARALTDKDTVVLADFDNKTGDAIFDDTLKQALSVQLGQSPFLNVLSDRKVEETLRLMGRPASERITRDVATELCVRAGSKAILVGSISNLGGEYVIGMNGIACNSGETLASEQEQAATKPDVLKALSKAAATIVLAAVAGAALGVTDHVPAIGTLRDPADLLI